MEKKDIKKGIYLLDDLTDQYGWFNYIVATIPESELAIVEFWSGMSGALYANPRKIFTYDEVVSRWNRMSDKQPEPPEVKVFGAEDKIKKYPFLRRLINALP